MSNDEARILIRRERLFSLKFGVAIVSALLLSRQVCAAHSESIGRVCRHEKTKSILPEGAPLPDPPVYHSKTPEGRELEQIYYYVGINCYEAWQSERAENFNSALRSYEEAVRTVRKSKLPLNKEFKQQVAISYAACLRKVGDTKTAQCILDEFIDSSGKDLNLTINSVIIFPLSEAQMKLFELTPWHDAISRKFQAQPDYEKTMTELLKSLDFYNKVRCEIVISRQGRIEKVVVLPEDNEPRNAMVRNFILRAGPFPAPPNDLPVKNGVTIDFFESENSIKTSFELTDFQESREGGVILKQ